MPRLKLTIAYTGTAYAGWQLQSPELGQSTIQNELEKAVTIISGENIRVHGAGRTDSGVHAEGQAAHIDIPETCRVADWARALNAKLPADIRVTSAAFVPNTFRACNDAVGKCYAYTLFEGRYALPPRLAPFAWAVPRLDTAVMHEAAAMLTGRHDFASFQNVGTPVQSTVRTVFSIREEKHRAAAFLCPPEWPVSTWFFEGEGFLKQMVRNLMGLLVWIGEGKLSPTDVPAILAANDRTALPSPSAPAQGLTLMRVDYPETIG